MSKRTLLSRLLDGGVRRGAMSARIGVGLLSASALAACSVSVTIKPQHKYTGTVNIVSTAWAGRAVVVHNANGNVTVNGDPAASAVTLAAAPFAFADGDKPADGTDAVHDVTATVSLSENGGQITVTCSQETQSHGTAAIATTGCDLTVTVPAGSASQGLALTAHTANGEVAAANLYGASNVLMQILTDNGSASGTGITGSVKVHTGNGDASGSVTPTQGAQIEVSTDNGDAALALPANFACDTLSLSSGSHGSVAVAAGFSNQVTATSTSVGTAGSGAASITVSTSTGNVALRPQ